MRNIFKSQVHKKRILAATMALLVAFTYSAPISAFAETKSNTASIVTNGEELFYDKEGKLVNDFNSAAVSVNKQIKKLSDEDEFEITLTVRPKKEVISAIKENDAAVVLVVDVSNSMMDTVSREEKLTSAKKAANEFLKSYVKNAGNAKRMVSVVQFGSSAKTVSTWVDANGKNDQVASAATKAVENVSNKYRRPVDTIPKSYIEERDWSGAWRCSYKSCSLSDWHPSSDTRHIEHMHDVKNTGSKLDSGGTNIEGGMMLARNLLSSSLEDAIKDIKYTNVIMLTDGVPTYHVGDQYQSTTKVDFMEGLRGNGKTATEPDWKDVPTISRAIKDADSSIYTIAYDLSNLATGTVNGRSVADWLTTDVGVTKNFKADNTTELFDAFSKINENIDADVMTELVVIEDPMGEFILFDNENVLNPRMTFQGNKLKIGIAKDDITFASNGEPNPYTYSYKVKLDTQAQGFEEGKEYAANGTTTLTYGYGSDETKQNVEFKVPSVEGKIPEVPYKVEYYKWDKETEKYPTVATKTVEEGTAKLWSEIQAPNGYMDAYRSESYHFAEGDAKLQLSSKTDNVLKLYYKPDLAKVVVKHYYKTDVINADGTKTEATEYVLGSTVDSPNLYVGDKFEAGLVSNLDGIEYTLNTKESDNPVASSVSPNGNSIKLYYDGVRDLRKTTSVVVNRIYETGSWMLNADTGRYEEVFTSGGPQEYHKSTEVKANSMFETSTIADVTKGYEFDRTDVGDYDDEAHKVSLKLSESENVINLTFKKPASESDKVKTEVIVKHQYFLDKKEVVNGQLVTTIAKEPTFTETEPHTDYYVGEYFTPTENNTNGDITYKSDPGNAEKLQKYELKAGATEITFSYHYMQEPEKTSVTVNRIYRTHDKKYEEIIDEESGEVIGEKVVDVVTIDKKSSDIISTIKIDEAEEALYEGFAYAAVLDGELDGKNYVFNEKESTKDGKLVLKATDNEINLYYDIKEDTRDSSNVSVHHIYVTHLTTVENGKVVTKTQLQGVLATELLEGKAGDILNIEKQFVLENGDEYTLREENNFSDDTYTLKPGTNRTIEIVYEREHSTLKSTVLAVTHKYINKIMTVVKGVAGYYDAEDVIVEVTAFTVDGGKTLDQELQELYVGEKYTIDLVPTYDQIEYTPDKNNGATEITLADGDNNLEFKYYKETELPKTTVTVNHHYTHTTINGVGDKSVTTEEKTVEMPAPYVGTDVTTKPAEAGYDFTSVTVVGTEVFAEDAKTHDVAMTVSDAAVVVDYYYTKVTDNSVKSTWKVNHHYRTLDWNDTADKEYVADKTLALSGDSYATKTYTGVPILKVDDGGNATFKLDRATASSKFTDGYTITLAEGENTIDFYYTQKIDSRVGTVVKVVHNYYKHDVSGLVPDATTGGDTSGSAIETLPGVLAGTYEEVFTGKEEGAWVEKAFTAQQKNTYGEADNQLTYKFKDADPEDLTIKSLALADADNPNLIVINYVYEYDATANVAMKVNHVYRTRDTYTDTTTEETDSVIAKFGNDDIGRWNKDNKTFTAKEINKSGFTRATSNDDMTVTYSLGDNEMTVIYTRTTSSRPGGGGGGGSTGGGGGGNTGGGGTPDPGIDIPDEGVPLGDLPGNTPGEEIIIKDEDVPLGDAPVIIDDEEVPLAGLPKTGGAGILGFLSLGGILTALGIALRRRENKNVQ